MRRGLLSVLMMMCFAFTQAQDVERFVAWQLEAYPKSRLLDLYKSCFQDFMGAEHLVADRQRAMEYLDEELNATALDQYLPWYSEPCGTHGRFVRVSLRAVKEGLLTRDVLLDAFVESANVDRRPVEAWCERWQEIVMRIDRMGLDLPHYAEDRRYIDSILAAGKYAISHSPDYREAYRPHYRIVERAVFERKIAPLLPPAGAK